MKLVVLLVLLGLAATATAVRTDSAQGVLSESVDYSEWTEPAYLEAEAQATCTGSCQDVRSSRCATGFRPELICPGNNFIQCCLPKPPRSNRCPSSGASCSDITTNNCASGFQPQMICPGDNNVQCCIGGATPKPPPPPPKCTGSCVDVDLFNCNTGFKPQLMCPGGNDIQCCESAPVSKQAPVLAPNSQCPGSCQDRNTRPCATGYQPQMICPGAANIQCCPTVKPAAPPCLSKAGVELITSFEGFRADFYYDAAGIRTIGYGTACFAYGPGCETLRPPLTQQQAASIMAQQIREKFAPCVSGKVSRQLSPNAFSALVSFVYNTGCGGLADNIVANLNAGNLDAAGQIMLLYNRAGGRVLAGLTRRRQAEVALLKQTGGECF